jgi:hypothetical protein
LVASRQSTTAAQLRRDDVTVDDDDRALDLVGTGRVSAVTGVGYAQLYS